MMEIKHLTLIRLPVSRRVVPGVFHCLLESIVEVLLLAARSADPDGGGVHEVAHILVLAGPSLIDEDVKFGWKLSVGRRCWSCRQGCRWCRRLTYRWR